MRMRLLVALLVAISAAGCARQPRQAIATSSADAAHGLDALMYGAPAAFTPSPTQRQAVRAVPVRATAVPLDDGPYTLDSGDKLRVVVFGQETLSNTYAVDANGAVFMPLIGAVPARGLSATQLSAEIRSRLAAGFIRDPSVAVEIETYRPFFILGEVTFPGQYPYVANMSVETAVAIAGGFTPRAVKKTVAVTRKVHGTPTIVTLPLEYPLRPGDIVTVSERWF